MGNYITYDNLEYRMGNTRISKLSTGRDNDETYVNAVINRAESVINGYAGTLYVTPLPDSEVIQEWAMAIAEYEMYKNGQGGDVPLKYKTSYDEAMKMIQSMVDGKFIPPNTDDQTLARLNTYGNSIVLTSDESLMSDEDFYPNGSSSYIPYNSISW